MEKIKRLFLKIELLSLPIIKPPYLSLLWKLVQTLRENNGPRPDR